MLLIATTLALLAIYAGMKLMALAKKDGLGNMYKYMSWFIIIVSFLVLLCVGAHCLRMCMFHGERNMMMRTEMRDDGWGNRHMGDMNSRHGGMMMRGGECCGGMMNNCCGGMKDGCCDDGMGACKGDMKDNSCNMSGMKGCTMEKKDSVIVKKK